MAKNVIYAETNIEEYKWVIGKNDYTFNRTGKKYFDIFCKECRYDNDTCGYLPENCPYRKASQSEYLRKHGDFIDKRR